MPNSSSSTKTSNGGKGKASPPVHTVRFGAVKAAVWENQTQHGPMFNVTVSRSYKDENGDWQESSSFGTDDLLTLAKALDQAHSWIHEHRRSGEREKQDE